MPPTQLRLRDLSTVDVQTLESWLIDFERRWEPGLLAARARELPREGPLRAAALAEMVKIDLERQWRHGDRKSLEDYLRQFPELGDGRTVATDLIRADLDVRIQFGQGTTQEELERRFPGRTTEVSDSGASGIPPSPVSSATLVTANPVTHPDDRPSTRHPDTLPEQFGRYRILKRLGAGGMGSVWLAYDPQLDRKVAIKVPRLESGASPQLLERFNREGRAAAALHHPNVCPVHDVGEIGGVHFLAMAYLEGEPLSDVIRRGEVLPQAEAARVVLRLALALAEAHRLGVIHRDLKPSNVMMTPKGEPVVMDFGLARRSGAEEARLTSDGSMLGTPAYMPPEQMTGDVNAMGPGCDVYSLGVILYELLTGALPFSGPTPTQMMAQALMQEPQPPSARRPDLDPELEGIVMKAMAKKLDRRYASMSEFAGALDRYLEKTAGPANRVAPYLVETPPPAPAAGGGKTRRPRRRWPALAFFGGLFLLAGGIVIFMRIIPGGTVAPPVPERGNAEIGTLKGHDAPVTLVKFLKNGDLLSFGGDAKLRVWDVAKREKKFDLTQSAAWGDREINYRRVDWALSPDEKRVATWDRGSTKSAKIWDLEKREPVLTIPGATWPRFSPDGMFVAVAGDNPGVWSIADRKEVCPIRGHKGPVICVAFSPDGKTLATGGEDCEIRLWNPQTGERSLTCKPPKAVAPYFLTFVEGGKSLLSVLHVLADYDDVSTVWELEEGTEKKRWESGRPFRESLFDDRLLFERGAVDPLTLEAVRDFPHHLWACAVSPDGVHVAVAFADRIRIWDRKQRIYRAVLTGHTGEVYSQSFSPDGKVLASGSHDGTIRLWDVAKAISQNLDLKDE
jgi:WD40 repeat protein